MLTLTGQRRYILLVYIYIYSIDTAEDNQFYSVCTWSCAFPFLTHKFRLAYIRLEAYTQRCPANVNVKHYRSHSNFGLVGGWFLFLSGGGRGGGGCLVVVVVVVAPVSQW